MNNEEMYNAINKGIPNQVKLELPIDDLIRYCSSNSDELTKSMESIRNNYENAITSITGYNKSNHEFFNNLRLITNYKNSSTEIYASPICFLNRLKEILGVTNTSYDLSDQDLINDFNGRLTLLNCIDDVDDLKEIFPIIFEDYKYSLNLIDEIYKEDKINTINADIMRANYQKYGLDTRFKVFMSNQRTMYKNFVNHIKDIMDYADGNPIDKDNFVGLDKEKFELYVAYRYLEYAKNIDDDNKRQSAIYYITTYLNELCGQNIKMNYKDKEISKLSLLKDFRKLLKDNHVLKPINESRKTYNSYHIKHVKNHINKYLNSINNWCILRINANEILQNQQARIESLADYYMDNDDDSRDLAHRIQEKYIGMLMRKLSFYENTNYVLRLFGIGPFESHIAYLYDNGIVVVDKLYDEALDINPTYNEAIYIMDTNTFLNMSFMDKPVLRENNNVRRIIHSGNWEDRVMNEIENPSINLNDEDMKVLRKRFCNK